jgi:hypothetical protein
VRNFATRIFVAKGLAMGGLGVEVRDLALPGRVEKGQFGLAATAPRQTEAPRNLPAFIHSALVYAAESEPVTHTGA